LPKFRENGGADPKDLVGARSVRGVRMGTPLAAGGVKERARLPPQKKRLIFFVCNIVFFCEI